jgi:hypothetical protein
MECSCCVRVTCHKSVALRSVPQQPQSHWVLTACARLAIRRGNMGAAIMVHLGRCASGNYIGGSIVSLDRMILSDAIEVLDPFTDRQ